MLAFRESRVGGPTVRTGEFTSGISEQFHARARDPHFSRSLLRCANFLLQNCAIQRNAMRISLVLLSSEKHAAQCREKLRKSFSLNYKSAALDQLSYAGARAEK
ncbi:MAG: hypothetical protein DMF73_15880 [Acidobacteria bacterium]|nr:MAG: hypothetical protein DMF73_15880 [Acidobacteriota bacterium]